MRSVSSGASHANTIMSDNRTSMMRSSSMSGPIPGMKSSSRSRSPVNRISKSSSVSSLMKTLGSNDPRNSMASAHSLRNGKISKFNPKINDTFPDLFATKKVTMPVITLPKIVSLDPRTSSVPRSAVDRMDEFKSTQGNPLDTLNMPSASLDKATFREREVLKLFLGISDALLNDVDDYESTMKRRNIEFHDESKMISRFQKARKRTLSPTQSITTRGTNLTRDVSQLTMGELDMNINAQVEEDENSSFEGNSSKCTNNVDGRGVVSVPRVTRGMERFGSLPALDTKQFGSSALDIAASNLSPTWAIKSFVGLTGGGSLHNRAGDLDTLSHDGTVLTNFTEFSPKTVSKKRLGGLSKKSLNQSHNFKIKSLNANIDGMNAAEMKSELMNSLMNMQKHTVMVQEGILHVQDLVSIKDKKAKTVVATMAADRMKIALDNLLRKELRRGWDAWIQEVRAQSRMLAALHVNRFLKLRALAFLIRRWVLKILASRFDPWKQAYLEYKQFMENKLIFDAASAIQKMVRGMIARSGLEARKEAGRYRSLYNATIRIQALFRGKIMRWRYLRRARKILEDKQSRICQRVYRGYRARVRVYFLRLKILKNKAAIVMQCMVRKRIARRVTNDRRAIRHIRLAAVKIQSVIRMCLAAKNVHKIAESRYRDKMAIRIQKRARGLIARINLERKKKKMEQMRAFRVTSVVNIQRVYRGHRGRTYFKIKAVDYLRKRRITTNASTMITKTVRKFLARCLVIHLRKERFDGWVSNSKKWQETWSEDAKVFYYLHCDTGETLWEPPVGGYTKDDGMLVLENGETIINPIFLGMNKEEEYNNNRICSECSDRIAIRKCEECGDKFCTICYKETHATGTRRNHAWKPIGPIDCSDCEMLLAERWCVTCDEAFCDGCWRTIHAKGKRRWHPFCEVDVAGKVDSRMFTIDGTEVEGGYDSYSAQKQTDRLDAKGYEPNAFAYDPNGYYEGGGEEWTVYNDAEGNPYWYNNYTQQSQYEDPYASYDENRYGTTTDEAYYGYG